jgi:cell division protein FtsW (lipid II flippase)
MHMHEQPQQSKWYQSRLTWVLLGFLTVGAFFLITEHTAHFFGILPFLLLLLCPLMMLFMHVGHGNQSGHGEKGGQPGDRSQQDQPPEGGQL